MICTPACRANCGIPREAACAGTLNLKPAGPPVAPVRPVTEDLFGVKVTDPYRWMEAEEPEWKTYALAQADYARSVLDSIPGREALTAAVEHYTGAVVTVSAVQVGGEYIFTQVRPANAETFKLYVRRGVHGQDRMLLDPDAYAGKGSHASLDWWVASPDGSHVVFGTSPGGSENSTARILVTETGQVLPETIDRTEDASPSWAPDGSGFFYNRLQPVSSPDSLDKYKDSAAWFHRLNTDPGADAKALWKGSSPVVQQQPGDLQVTRPRGLVQRGVAGLVHRRRLGVMSQERPGGLQMPVARGEVQGSRAAVVLRVGRGAGAQQEFDHLGMTLGGRAVQRGDLAVLAAGDAVGIVGQDRPDGVDVAGVRGFVQVSHPLAASRVPLAVPETLLRVNWRGLPSRA